MAQVNVSINNRVYRMACADGEEDHLRDLALRLNDMIDQFRAEFGEIGDQRLTVMAAIKLADDLDTVQQKMARLRQDAARIGELEAAAHDAIEAAKADAAEAIVEAAARVTAATRRLAVGPGEGAA